MKFKARILVEREIIADADTSSSAELAVRANIPGGTKYKVLGVIPADQRWDDEEELKRPPPRSTPPSGSPNTPTLDAQPELLQAVAA